MATLLLSVAGSVIGGPIGGSVGALIGQQIDQNILFRPKGREGPRLQDLAVQTSSYGSQIPRIFGKMRVAGTVIWATDLKETRNREGGGKGRPSTTVYSYSASFAVALSSRRIRDVGRIWADGKIFRGAAGDFKTETQFALHVGGEDQTLDGLMASAEGAGRTPAYRDYALAVFGDMDLTEYGNRIPSLTFEVIADDGLVTIAELVTDMSGERIVLPPADTVIGFAAGGEDRQAALRSLTESIPLSFSSDPRAIDRIEAEVRSASEVPSVVTITSDFVRAAGNQDIPPPETRTAAVALVPRQLSVRYYDPARDYQAGVQSALRPGIGRTSLEQDFPATIAAGTARRIAMDVLLSAHKERSSLNVSVPLGSHPLRPAMLVRFDGFEGFWRIRECEIGANVVQLSLTSVNSSGAMALVDSEQGRNVAAPDLRAGLTRLVLVDLPFAIDAPTVPSDQVRLYAAAAGDAGWRNAQLFASGPDGTPGAYVGQIPAPTVIGNISGALGAANPSLIDQINHIDVVLRNEEMTLDHADDQQLLAGRNAALIGREVVQFAEAELLEEGRFRLSRLIRGLGGTEAEISRHVADEDFVLLDAGSLLAVNSSAFSPFSPTSLFAVGRDDPVPVEAAIAAPGRALMPWSPVHPGWNFHANGDLEIQWTRRSRAGMIWPDHVEVSLAEEIEKYRVELSADDGSVGTIMIEPEVPNVTLTVEQIDPFRDGSIDSMIARIRQIGSYGLSEELMIEIPL
ncbi:phage tail protein [Parasphingorhabdus flavimaris]|uniref:GTA baseplate fiber-binding domain-containing protein n=1 Tax=Parasphingorhabdus flavimaris TaxID=266812 RepID=UPI00300293A8